MSYRCQNSLPIHKAIFLHDSLSGFGSIKFLHVDIFCFTILFKQNPTLFNIVRSILCFKPLTDLGSGLRTLTEFQPVSAGTGTVQRSLDLNTVTILNLITNGLYFSIYNGTYHAVTYCGMNSVGKIHCGGTFRHTDDLSLRSKAKYAV